MEEEEIHDITAEEIVMLINAHGEMILDNTKYRLQRIAYLNDHLQSFDSDNDEEMMQHGKAN